MSAIISTMNLQNELSQIVVESRGLPKPVHLSETKITNQRMYKVHIEDEFLSLDSL